MAKNTFGKLQMEVPLSHLVFYALLSYERITAARCCLRIMSRKLFSEQDTSITAVDRAWSRHFVNNHIRFGILLFPELGIMT
jgi:hypothetical protein